MRIRVSLSMLCIAALVLVACGRTAPAADADVRSLADAYLAAYLDRFPELVTSFGIAGRHQDRLTDNTPAALQAWQQKEDGFLRQATAIDAATIGEPHLRATYAILREALEASTATRVCRTELWNVSEMSGWHTSFGYLLTIQPVGTPVARQEALARWSRLPAYIDTEIANAREGLRRGYSAPKGNVRIVIDEVRTLVAMPFDTSPFGSPAMRDSDPAFRRQFTALVTDRILPAARRYLTFLEGEYLPAARDAIAVSINPGGEDCYVASIRASSSLPKLPREVHALGLSEMDRITTRMRAIARRSFGTDDLPALLTRVKTDRQYLFKDRADLLAYSHAALDRAKAAAPAWFGRLPKADVRLEPYPPYREKSGPSEYNGPAEDGSHPGLYYVSAYQAETKSRVTAESIAFHETIPGHHLQIALAMEQKAIHPIGRYMGNSGFSEGWGLYAEELADEMHLYSSDLDRLGMLGSQAFRAARLVVDTGIHAMGWTRQQAIDYMLTHTAEPENTIAPEIDRYIILPGQATSYMLGMLEIRAARQDAENRLGSRFNVKAFHDHVLEDGGVPLTFLRQKLSDWVGSGGA